MSTPYQQAAAALFQAGWSPLPLGERSKIAPPAGTTGEGGRVLSAADVVAYLQDPTSGNVAIRLPREVIGLDVDAYDSKLGAATLAALESEHGALPKTTMVTSRHDGVSGIRFYRLPAGIDQSQLGTGLAGVDVIRFGHRYALVPPSVHPITGEEYRWLTSNGEASVMPTPNALPELPLPFVQAFLKNTPAPAPATPPAASVVSASACRVAETWLAQALAALRTGVSRHDAAVREAARGARLEDFGHQITAQINTFGEVFISAITDRLPRREAEREWRSILETARALVAKDASTERRCCEATDTLRDATDLLRATRHADLMVAGFDSAASEADGEDESSWAPIDLSAHWDGIHTRPKAGLLHRTDGHGLLYPGRVHSFYGESESGKSWLAQIATANVLKAGGAVAYIDFEADAGDIVDRLRLLGLSKAQAARLRYLRPESARQAEDPYWLELLQTPTDLVVIDGVTEALTMWGGETKDNDTITQWTRKFPRALARATGAAVVTIDHVPKDKESRGRFALGGQAKLATIDGAAYLIEPVEVLAPGKTGQLTLRVTKDRPGAVRAIAGLWRKSDRTQEVAVAEIDATLTPLAWRLLKPRTEEETRVIRDEKTRQSIIDLLLPLDGTVSFNWINERVTGKRDHLSDVVKDLKSEGIILEIGAGKLRLSDQTYAENGRPGFAHIVRNEAS